MSTLKDWAEIQRLPRAEQLPTETIAKVSRVSKNRLWCAGESLVHRADLGKARLPYRRRRSLPLRGADGAAPAWI